MPVSYRPWISPYGDDDFEWDRNKSPRTFGDRDLIFEAARIVFRGPLIRRQDTRPRRPPEPRFMVLGELYGRVMVIIYTPRNRRCRIISLRPANAIEREISMITRPDRPREYFAKLLDQPDDAIDYSDIPRTTAADWQDAEVLLPVTPEEFRAIKKFVQARREREEQTAHPHGSPAK